MDYASVRMSAFLWLLSHAQIVGVGDRLKIEPIHVFRLTDSWLPEAPQLLVV